MRIFICLLLSLGGVLSALQMDKDLQYNCYYQILKEYSTKSNYFDDDYIDYNHRSDDSLQLSIKDTESAESSLLRVRRNSITDTVESDKTPYHNRNHLTRTFSSAYAEPRNSGHFRHGRDDLAPSKTFTIQNVTGSDFVANNFSNPEVSYLIVASKTLHPGFVYKVSVSVLQAQHPIKVFANISCNSVNLSTDTKDIPQDTTETLLLRIPPTALRKQTCRLRMEGFFLNVFCDLAFLHEQALEYVQHSHMIFIQTDKPLYMQGNTVRFRVTVTNADFKPSDCIIEVLIIDPNQHIVRRWLTQLPPAGTVALDYRLAKEPSFGDWTINVGIAELGGQQEKLNFSVEEYYRALVDVEVIMPAVLFSTTAFIKGSVTASSTFGSGEVIGNLTLVATIYPLGYLNAKALNRNFRLGFFGRKTGVPYEVSPELYEQPKGLLNRTVYNINKPNTYDYYNEILVNGTNFSQKFVRNFNGSYIFKWPKDELEKLQDNFTALELLVTATVTVDSENEVYAGYAIARIYKPTIRVVFLGGSPQVFKPSLPFTVLIAAEHLDGSPIDSSLLKESGQVEVSGTIHTQVEAAELSWPKRRLHELRHHFGIWELKIDLRNDLLQLSHDALTEITEMRLKVNFATASKENANLLVAMASAELLLIAHYSPRHQYIKVTTSTELPIVGEYMIFEISTNFYVQQFHYMILSKGVIVFSERESLKEGMRTIALVVGAEMAPVAEIVVWTLTWQGQVVTDSLIFPVTGMFINNFTVSVQNSHKNTVLGNKFYEVSISGESGSYVSLLGIAQDANNMQPDASMLCYSTVISKMSSLDKNMYKMHKHVWNSHRDVIGESDAVFYETSTFGIDANDTFFESGLLVFTDGVVPRWSELCNQSVGSDQLTGLCILFAKRRNILNSFNGCDQMGCNQELLSDFKRFRINRIFRHYDNVVWFWKDVQIGIGGRLKFHTGVPSANVDQWLINSYSTSLTKGLGFRREALAVAELKKQPFAVDVALPSHCRRYEHVGIRVIILNKRNNPLVATISLKSSADYSQIVNKNEKLPISLTLDAHQQKSVDMYFRPTSLDSITVALKVQTAYGFIDIQRNLNVESDDIRHGQDQQFHRLQHNFILLNLTNEQTNLVEYLKSTKPSSSALKWKRISLVGNAFAASFVSSTLDRFLDATRETAQEFAFANHLYSLMYLRLTKKHNASSERDIFYNMNLSYQHLLGFLGPDGSFTHFRNADGKYSESSVWLTAYCLRLFQEASLYKMIDYIWIDTATIIDKALNWLLQQQTSTGGWMQTDASDLHENNVTLTAHVLITLTIMRDFNDSFTMRIKEARDNAATWIERNLHHLQNSNESYDLAVTTYALLLHKSSLAERTLSLLRSLARRRADNFMYWSSSKLRKSKSMFERYDSISTEATAYALLCYLMHRDSDVDLIVNWLNLHRLRGDGQTMATRASNAAMRALIEFTANSRRRDSTAITVKLTSLKFQPRINYTLHINSSNSVIHSIQLFDVWGPLKISAYGVGYAILQVDQEEEHVDVDNDARQLYSPTFRIHNKAICRCEDCSHISYTCCINWLNMEQTGRSGMSILDVAIPTGYRIEQQKLHSYVLSKSIKHLVQAKLMETRILFYFLNLVEEDVCVDFIVKRWYNVANLTRFLPIHVYEYNAPEHFAETTQNALSPQSLLNTCAVCGSSSCINCLFNTSAREATTCELHALLFIICCLISLQAKKILP